MSSQAPEIEINPESIKAGMLHLRENDPVQLARLNDFAEIMIWGSNGRNVYTFDHPNDDFLLLATKANPMRGILDVVQDEPYSLRNKPQEERDEEAEKRALLASTYESTILAFVESGMELAAAKDIVDSSIIVGMPLPERPHRVLLEKELRAKRRAIYLSKGGELPFEDSDVPEEVEYVNYLKTPKPKSMSEFDYDLAPRWASFMRSNILNVFGPEWPRKAMSSGSKGFEYKIQDVKDGVEAKANPGWLNREPRMPYAPFYPGDRSQWSV